MHVSQTISLYQCLFFWIQWSWVWLCHMCLFLSWCTLYKHTHTFLCVCVCSWAMQSRHEIMPNSDCAFLRVGRSTDQLIVCLNGNYSPLKCRGINTGDDVIWGHRNTFFMFSCRYTHLKTEDGCCCPFPVSWDVCVSKGDLLCPRLIVGHGQRITILSWWSRVEGSESHTSGFNRNPSVLQAQTDPRTGCRLVRHSQAGVCKPQRNNDGVCVCELRWSESVRNRLCECVQYVCLWMSGLCQHAFVWVGALTDTLYMLLFCETAHEWLNAVARLVVYLSESDNQRLGLLMAL